MTPAKGPSTAACTLMFIGVALAMGFSAIAWFMPASQDVGLPLPSMMVTFQPIFSAASLM